MTTALREHLQATLGHTYTLERELGGGGMARVFVATETALGRRVVVKVLAPDLAACCDADRFRREIQLAASLQHPHIVPLLNACESCGPGGLLYFTMPYVEGETLRARLAREGALPVAEAARLIREVAGALAYAHRRGIVHRDVKPANVLVSDGHALVADFGVAKALEAASLVGAAGETALGTALDTALTATVFGATAPDETGLTRVGTSVGTPTYMAPEQAVGDPATDHRADLYALGVMAYELLAGEPPFTGRSPRALVRAHLTEAPVVLSTRRPDVPPALAALVMRLLQKRAEDRPQSADEVLRDLNAATSPTGDAAPSPGPRGRPGISSGPSGGPSGRWMWGGIAVALLALAGLLLALGTAGGGTLGTR
jgi:eukaryotic-like serine/threonine-protein kinase